MFEFAKKSAVVALSLFLAFGARAELPPLLPREILFGNPERAEPQISPDGGQIAWLAPDKNGVLNVWASALDGTNPHTITNETDARSLHPSTL